MSIHITEAHIEHVKKSLEGRYVTSDDGQHLISTDGNRQIGPGGCRLSESAWLYMIEHGIRSKPVAVATQRICDVQHCIRPEHQLLVSSPSWKTLAVEDDWTYLRHALNVRSEEIPGGCRIWNSSLDRGYPRFEERSATHWVYFLMNRVKEIPNGRCVARTCANQLCIADAHIVLATAELAFDFLAPSRHMRLGSRSPRSKMPIELARQIKFSKGCGTKRDRAEEFGVTVGIVNDIDHERSWAWLGRSPAEDNHIKRGTGHTRQGQRSSVTQDSAFFNAGRGFIHSKLYQIDEEYHWITIYKTSERHPYPCVSFRGVHWSLPALSWIVHNEAPVPTGCVVRHKCGAGHEFCVNPDHLEIGTYSENALDRIRDNTMPLGQDHYNAKIDNETAKAIKDSRGEGTPKERALRFNVSRAIISNIDLGLTWKHI